MGGNSAVWWPPRATHDSMLAGTATLTMRILGLPCVPPSHLCLPLLTILSPPLVWPSP